ncbi:YebG family protein [uncultured Desulfobacter sp.]|uniref:YebG family protein n=1 Tax=uncultured Desulfobacter sp. TaxID=240139 RepID=UPI002AAA91F3|nr:YebG family protein [uncultured Desulfobacter sp.]
MAIVVKYIVVRDGDEKMTFATKKEADAYDKMLDIADNLFDFLEHSDIKLDETRREEISLLLAEKRDEVTSILKGVSPKAKPSRKKSTSSSATAKATGKTSEKQADKTKAVTEPDTTSVPKSAAKAASPRQAASAKKSV